MRTDSPQTVHLSSLVQTLYSPGSIWYPSPSGPSPSPPLATPLRSPHLVGQFSCLALAFTQPPSALSSILKRVTDRASVSSPQCHYSRGSPARVHCLDFPLIWLYPTSMPLKKQIREPSVWPVFSALPEPVP